MEGALQCTLQRLFLLQSTLDTIPSNSCLSTWNYAMKLWCVDFSIAPIFRCIDLQTLESALEEPPPSTQNSLLLLGDFNIDYCPSAKTTHLYSLHSIEDKLSHQQECYTTRPASSMLIDHVYITERLSHSPCDILPPLSGSDHSTLLFSLSGYKRMSSVWSGSTTKQTLRRRTPFCAVCLPISSLVTT